MNRVARRQMKALDNLLALPQEKLQEKFEAFCQENPTTEEAENSCDLSVEEKLRIAREALIRIQNRRPGDVLDDIVRDALLRTKD